MKVSIIIPIYNRLEIDAFLELSCFFSDPADVGNLISGSSAFSMGKEQSFPQGLQNTEDELLF